MRLLLSLIFIFSIFSVQNIYAVANDVPNKGTVFRVDTRPPDEIFRDGFRSWGDDDNVRDHSTGASCYNHRRESAFVAVTTDPEYAGQYARRLAEQMEGTAYVYIITSRDNMYNFFETLRLAGYQTGLGMAERQSEWIAVGSIAANTISGVRAYVHGVAPTPPVIHNPNFNPSLQPQINTQSYRQRTADALPGEVVWEARRNPVIGACMAATLWCSHSSARSNNVACRFREQIGPVTWAALEDNKW
ncbi:hypothetical protein CGLAMM_02030 [Acetobacteraceae bacterium EV16G]|uniref:Uncharacterized protein n=1 Tax=Sorlinia euscelidii TaxID=3081148 RepID=A0ABU7U459_9PROT